MRIHSNDTIWNIIFIFIIVAVVGSALWIRGNNNSIKVIDNCQYIRTWNGHGFNLTHKGNCTNIIHYKK